MKDFTGKLADFAIHINESLSNQGSNIKIKTLEDRKIQVLVKEIDYLVINLTDDFLNELSNIKAIGSGYYTGDKFLVALLTTFSNREYDMNDANGAEVRFVEISGCRKGKIDKELINYYPLVFLNLPLLLNCELPTTTIEIELTELLEWLRDNFYVLELQGESSLEDSTTAITAITSSILNISYHYNAPFVHVSEIDLSRNNDKIVIKDVIVPQDLELIPSLYFLSAEQISFGHLKYLEYYHVFEYFYLYSSIKLLKENFDEFYSYFVEKQGRIDYRNYLKFGSEINHIFSNRDEFKEIESIKVVFRDLIKYDKLARAINELSFNVNHLKKEMWEIENTSLTIDSVFSDTSRKLLYASEIEVGTGTKSHPPKSKAQVKEITDKFCTSLAARVLNVRNYIVHSSMKYSGKEPLKVTKENLLSLDKDVLLVRRLAYELLLTMKVNHPDFR